MALDTISTQFSVVDAAQEGAMRTSQAANLRNCEVCDAAKPTRNAQPIKPIYIDSRSAAASTPGPSGTLGMPWVRVSILKTERCAICGSHVASI